MRALLIAGLLASAPAFAGPVAMWKGDGVKVFAYTDPCEVPEIAMILAQFSGKPLKAAVQIGTREFSACYVLEDDKVILIDSAGNAGYIPAADFVEARGV